jgi:hypothetical protein
MKEHFLFPEDYVIFVKSKNKIMAVTIESTELLKTYFDGVLHRADHHAKEVEHVSLSLLGAVIWKSVDEIQVREVKEGFGNVLWFRTGGNRYALCYNHATKKIELRDRTQQGETLEEFDNSTPSARVFEVFKNL